MTNQNATFVVAVSFVQVPKDVQPVMRAVVGVMTLDDLAEMNEHDQLEEGNQQGDDANDDVLLRALLNENHEDENKDEEHGSFFSPPLFCAVLGHC